MRADLKLLRRLLVYVGRAVNAELLRSGRQWDRPHDLGACALRCINDLHSRTVQRAMIICPEADSDTLAFHLIEIFLNEVLRNPAGFSLPAKMRKRTVCLRHLVHFIAATHSTAAI